MAATDTVKLGIEGTLYYNLDYDADENVTTGWVKLGYVTDLSMDEDPQNYEYYDKYTLQPAKKGRPQNGGSIGQMFCKSATSVYSLAKAGNAIAFRLDIQDNGEGPVTEQFYTSTVNLKKRSFKPGNLNESGEMSVSVDFSYANSHFVQP